MRVVITTLVLFAIWLLMSGLFKPLLISLGAASVIVVVLVGKRMDAVDGDRVELNLRPIAFLRYLVWLLVEIFRANWTVTKIILSAEMPIRQHLFSVPSSQTTEVGQVIFANSITLTPGTITVETEGNNFLVHAVAFDSTTCEELADMDQRVSVTETQGLN